MTEEGTILLTGATGNVGAVTLEHILASNTYKVNIVVRKATSIALFSQKYPSETASGRLTTTLIPDLSLPGVFDVPASTACFIVHVATPLAGTDWERDMIEPTWAIDKNVLAAAQKSASVKRVVICGTLLQAVDINQLRSLDTVISAHTYNPISLDDARNGPWRNAYMYSKSNAERRMWAWLREQEAGGAVSFDIVMLLPPTITGRSPQVGWRPTTEGMGGIPRAYHALMVEKTAQEMDNFFPIFLDTDDVASIHIQALDRDRVPGNRRYVLASDEPVNLRSIAARLRREHPELRDRLPDLSEEGDLWTKENMVKVDTSESDAIFGTNWKAAYDSVKETVFDVLRWEKENGSVMT